MKNKKLIVIWAPRVLMILYIVFFSLFSLDVFSEDWTWREMLIGFFIHNIPTLVLIGVLIAAWKRKIVGAVGFLALAVFAFFFFNLRWESFVFLILPLLITSGLFYWGHYLEKNKR